MGHQQALGEAAPRCARALVGLQVLVLYKTPHFSDFCAVIFVSWTTVSSTTYLRYQMA